LKSCRAARRFRAACADPFRWILQEARRAHPMAGRTSRPRRGGPAPPPARLWGKGALAAVAASSYWGPLGRCPARSSWRRRHCTAVSGSPAAGAATVDSRRGSADDARARPSSQRLALGRRGYAQRALGSPFGMTLIQRPEARSQSFKARESGHRRSGPIAVLLDQRRGTVRAKSSSLGSSESTDLYCRARETLSSRRKARRAIGRRYARGRS